MKDKRKEVIKKLNGELTQEEKIELHLSDILEEANRKREDVDLLQIQHNVFEIREHLKDEDYV